jgi:hypothetical protein
MNIFGWIFLGLAVFLIADAVLALIFGRLYILWGLGYTPKVYRDFITRFSTLFQGTVLGVKLAECAAGLVLFWFALRMM